MFKINNPIINNWFVIFILFISGWKFTYGLEKVLDIGLYDESKYLYNGVALLSNRLPTADSAPLYAVWYYLLNLFQSDRIQLYYLNFKILTVLTPILFFILLRKYEVRIIPSAIVSFLLLISSANLPVWPKVSHFALIIVLAVFILATYVKKSLINSLTLISFGSLLVAYVRPEFFLTYLLFLLIIVGLVMFSNKNGWQLSEISAIVALILTSALLMRLFGLPFSGNRSFGAFGQHFAFNWTQWNVGSGLSPWTNWQEIINQNFGNINSPWEALKSNPLLFQKHVFFNLIRSPKLIIDLFFQHTNLIFPDNLKEAEGKLLFGLCVLYILFSRKKWLPELPNKIKTNRNLWIFFSCYLVPSFIAIIIIYPRSHYLLLPGILLILGLIILIHNDNEQQEVNSRTGVILLSLILLFLTPYINPGNEIIKPNIQTIMYIRTLQVDKNEINMLEAEGGFCIYLNKKCHRVAETEKKVDFIDFLNNEKINMVVLSNRLMTDTRFRDDGEWIDFLQNYTYYGYEKLDIPGTDRKLIIQKQLLNQ